MKPGTKWVFENEYGTTIDADGTIGTIRWKDEQTVVGIASIPEGKLVKLSVRSFDIEDDLPADKGDTAREVLFQAISTDDHYWLVNGNYVYFLPAELFDGPGNKMRPGIAKRFADDEFVPDLFFPMGAAKVWAERKRERDDMERARLFRDGKGPAPNPTMYYWRHIGVERVETPAGTFNDAHHLTYFTIGGPSNVWFVPGTGIVKRAYSHQGSYIKSDSVLIAYENGK